jgi:glycosyltransferase involved in cell wall biosynthesis
MKYAVYIPTYNRPELLQITIGSIINDPSNPGFPIFVSSDSDSSYRTKEIKNLKKICNNRSNIYYIDIERSELYKRQLEKLSGLSRETIDIAMNGGSAGANRNRLLLLACTYGTDGIIFSDDDMEVDEDFIEHHTMALGKTISEFSSKLKQEKGIEVKLNPKLNSADLDRIIGAFSAGWERYFYKTNIDSYKKHFRDDEYLSESIELDAANLSLMSSVYNTIPFPILHICEDYVFGEHAKKVLESVNGITLKGSYSISVERSSESTDLQRETETDFYDRGPLINISRGVARKLSISLGEKFGREFIKTIGKKIQGFVQFKEKQGSNLHRTGILYQNWSELTDAAKKIDNSILEEFLVTE